MRRLRENNNDSEKPIVKKRESLLLPQEFTGQIKLKLWLIKNYEHKVDALLNCACMQHACFMHAACMKMFLHACKHACTLNCMHADTYCMHAGGYCMHADTHCLHTL